MGVAVIDRFTHLVLQFAEGINKTSHASMQDLVSSSSPTPDAPRARNTDAEKLSFDSMQFNSYNFDFVRSHPGVRADLFRRPLSEVRVTDFLGAVARADVIPSESIYNEVDPTSQESSAPTFVSEPLTQDSVNSSEDEGRETPSRKLNWEEPRSEGTQTPLMEGQVVRTWASIAIIGSLAAWIFKSR